MRKGEKLYNHIIKKLYENSEIKYHALDVNDSNVGSEIREMSDDEFDEIILGRPKNKKRVFTPTDGY